VQNKKQNSAKKAENLHMFCSVQILQTCTLVVLQWVLEKITKSQAIIFQRLNFL